MRNIELLAPAGDAECLDFALRYGADAVYVGAKEFSMRNSCANFSAQELRDSVEKAHALGKKVYLTMNTMPTNEEIAAIPNAMRDAQAAGVDAFIIADLGVLAMAKKHVPDMELHLSTQAGTANYATACAAYEMGASRVVLARELSLEDISVIRENTPKELELEVFVHGAMCMSVSGRCLLSNYLTGRDANRGMCTQSCRWKYSLVEEKRPGQYFNINEDEHGSYIMNADDLCAISFLDKVVQAGADSLKIEGRGKTFYYVACVTAAYRAALNAVLQAGPGEYKAPDFAVQELEKTSHRPFSSGFFLGPQGATQNTKFGGYIREWQVVGVVEKQKGNMVHCIQRGKFFLGEPLEVLLPEGRVINFVPDILLDGDGEPIETTPHTKMEFIIKFPDGEIVPQGSILRRKIEDN